MTRRYLDNADTVELLAYGYGVPSEPVLIEVRHTWWRLRRQGVLLPAERRVILIARACHRNLPTSNRKIRSMTKQELKSLRTVINYLWHDEQRHFEDMEAASDDPGDHVFLHLLVLDGCLTRQAEI